MASSFAPPGRWQGELTQQHRDAQSAVLTTTAEAGDLDGVSVAWKHVKNVVRDDGKSTDLHDLLPRSVKETAYSPQVAGVSTLACSGTVQCVMRAGPTPPQPTWQVAHAEVHKSQQTLGPLGVLRIPTGSGSG